MMPPLSIQRRGQIIASKLAAHTFRQPIGLHPTVSCYHRQFRTTARDVDGGGGRRTSIGGRGGVCPARGGIVGRPDPPRLPGRSSSSGGRADDSVADDDEPPADDDVSAAHFPWRHESRPPARLLEYDDLSGMPNNFRGRFVRRLVSCKEMNLSPWDAMPIPFFARGWEEELANNFKSAFEYALEELLSSIHRGTVPVRRDGGVISIDTSKKDKASTESNLIENNEYLHRMLDKRLIAKYQSFDPDNHHLKLSIGPIKNTNLELIFTVPLLSRDIVENKPHLRGAYQRIEKAFANKASFDEVKKMTYDLANEIGEENAFTRTVIADVTIVCSEFFQLKDARSGIVLQGMEDGCEKEVVVHNVRFEVVTERNDEEDGKFRKVGSWKIIDIDDVLDGNVFH